MENRNEILLASLLVVGSGVLWGFYWVPVRRLADLGLHGAWGTFAIVGAASVLLAPFAFAGRHRLRRSSPVALASVALGGFAFVLYSVGFLYGRVAIIVILFFLTPVWATLIGRYIMGWPTPRMRYLALGTGLVGMALILGADGELPVPHGTGEWLGLISGLLWAVATTGIRAHADTGPGETAFVFAAGACIGALLLAPTLEPPPDPGALAHPGALIAWALVAGGLWWGASTAALMWAAARLDPARVGILLMIEVLVGAASAAVLAAERLGPVEMAGGALVLCAGILEVWPQRRGAEAGAPGQ